MSEIRPERSKRFRTFAPVETVLVIIALAILGFTAWYAWNGWHNTNKAYDTSLKTGNTTIAKTTIKTFDQCTKAVGSKLLQTYPEQCVTKDGKKFTDTTATKAAADSPMPAAGACGTTAGSVVTVTLTEGIPDPRCSQVTASQTLKVVNPTSQDVTVSLGNESVSIPAGQSGTITIPFGDYLETGDHVMKTSPALYGDSGAEIYLPAS